MKRLFLKEILPSVLLEHFTIVTYQKLGNALTRQMELMIYLDEKNILPEGCSPTDYESKGFLPSSCVQDFPIRGQAVFFLSTAAVGATKRLKKRLGMIILL